MVKHPGQQLDRHQERKCGPARDHPADRPALAAATFAARLAVVPAASAAHGSEPARRPERRSASSTSEATISMPSTDSGNACACHPVFRARRPVPACAVADRARDCPPARPRLPRPPRGQMSAQLAGAETAPGGACDPVPARVIAPPSGPVTCAAVPAAGHLRPADRGSYAGTSGPPNAPLRELSKRDRYQREHPTASSP